MKKIIILMILIVACSGDDNSKPIDLMSENEMVGLKFVNSNFYYSSNPKQYLKIYSKLDFRLNQLKDSLTNELNILTIKRKDAFN